MTRISTSPTEQTRGTSCPCSELGKVAARPTTVLMLSTGQDVRPFTNASAEEDDSVFPSITAFPGNWLADSQRTARVPEILQAGNANSIEPPGYVDIEDGGDDLIRFAVRDHGRRGVYSIGSDDSEIRDYYIHGLYHVGASRAVGYSGTFGIELGYRLELAQMEVL